MTNEDFYRSKYASFLRPFLARRNDIEAVVEAFTQRFDGLSPKINGDIVETNKGNYLLFPEAELEYANVVATIPAMHNMLNSLKEKFGIPFVVINDENFK